MQVAARTGAWSGERLPYDAEVAWIMSRHYSITYIETSLFADSSTKVSFRFMCGLVYDDLKIAGVFGTHSNFRGGISVYYKAFRSASPELIFEKGKIYDYELSNCIGSINGSTIDHGLGRASQTMRFGSFKENAPGGQDFSVYRDDVWMYSIKVWQNESAVLDLIPVRFTNENGVSEGAMYDRVSGQLFRNAGTGAFVIGPDKAAANGGGGGISANA